MIRMHTPLDAMRLIHWASGAPMASKLPISDPDPDPGLLGPDSLSWRLHEEQWLITAGARAFLLQAAHPKVAQGALDHSSFAEDPLGRYAAGETYSAMEPSALLWVHIVFVDSMLTSYKTFVGPLSNAECEQYWKESCRYARLLGLTDTTLPASYAAVQQYIREAFASGEIAIGPAAHFIAQKVLYPPMPLLRRPLWAVVRLITVGQLPPDIRQAYGLRWTSRHRVGFRLARGAGHLLRRLFPNALGRSPLVNFARRRTREIGR